jgi:hypothetical protein
MRRYLLLAVAFALAVPVIVSAQRRRDERGFERISRVIADCEERSNVFRQQLRRALDRSALNETRREDELNRDASRLERALNRIRESWNVEHDARKTRVFVNEAITASQDINRTMGRRRLHPDVQRQWGVVRGELNRLADVFQLPRIRW